MATGDIYPLPDSIVMRMQKRCRNDMFITEHRMGINIHKPIHLDPVWRSSTVQPLGIIILINLYNVSLQITGWPGLNDRKNYIATDEEFRQEALISVIRAIFARIKKKKKRKEKRKREKIVRKKIANCVFDTIARSLSTTTTLRLRLRWNYANFSPTRVSMGIYKQRRKTE